MADSNLQPSTAFNQDTMNLENNDNTSLVDLMLDSLVSGYQNFIDHAKNLYEKVSDNDINDEYLLTVSQQQINDALERFVTKNVKAILELRVEIHEGWFRLFCTVNVMGIYAEVAGNFGLVQVQLDRHRQRFVFEQKGFTDVIKLRCESFLKLQGIKLAIWFFHKVLKKDPLGLVLEKLKLAYQKNNIIYLSIHRWLKNNKKIMNGLYKAQVNYGSLAPEQLILRSQINFDSLFASHDEVQIITEDDAPNKDSHHQDAEKSTPSQSTA